MLSAALVAVGADAAGGTCMRGGTYVCMEGPQFSTRAESHLYRQWGADVIGMTNLQEAKLAREAEICFATLALATDYDCWHEVHDDVVIGDVLRILNENVATAQRVDRRRPSRICPASAPAPARGRWSTPSSPIARASRTRQARPGHHHRQVPVGSRMAGDADVAESDRTLRATCHRAARSEW